MLRSRDYKLIAKDRLNGKWGISLLVTFIASVLGAAGSSAPTFTYTFNNENTPEFFRGFFSNPILTGAFITAAAVGVIAGIALLVVGSAIEQGHNVYYLDLLRREPAGVPTLFSRFKYIGKAFGLRMYMMLFVFLWSLLFVVPGIIAAYRYAMATRILAEDPSKGIRQCVEESKAMMYGNKGRLFGLHMSFIGWVLLGALTLGVLYLWISPWMMAADTAFYLDLVGQLPEGRGFYGAGAGPATGAGPEAV